MNFYLDFEATQFSNQIISIGCVAENGSMFSTLVNPGEKEKISKFITELTGITKDMVRAAPGMDEAFSQLKNFVLENSKHMGEPHYFCYGDSDSEFIKHSIRHMKDTENIIFAQSILYALFDYSQSVKRFFHSEQSIALRKLFSFIQESEVVQKHDALEDAQMLYDVADKMIQFCHPEDLDKIRSIPGQQKPKVKNERKKAPDAFVNMRGTIWSATTWADENDYQIKCEGRGDNVKYFNNIETAVMWIIKYITGGSPKKENIVRHREKEILRAISNKTKYCGLYWSNKK